MLPNANEPNYKLFDPTVHTGGGFHILARMLELDEPFHPYVMGDEEIPEANALDYRYRIKLARSTGDLETGLRPSFTCVTVVDLRTDREHHRSFNTDQLDRPLILSTLAIATEQVNEQWVVSVEVAPLLRALSATHGIVLPVELLVGFTSQSHNGYVQLAKADVDYPGCYAVTLPISSDAGRYGIYVDKVQLVLCPLGFYDGNYKTNQEFYRTTPEVE